MAIARAGLSMVNEAPYGSADRGDLSFWYETQPFLNAITIASGSGRAQRAVLLAEPETALKDLTDQGLRYVVVFRDDMKAPEFIVGIEELLDRHTTRVADDGNVAVWEIPRAVAD